MVAFTEFSRRTQQTLCLLMSAVIVASSLFAASYAAKMAAHDGYSVTITQLQ
jgi:hypothetical protein